MLQVIELPSEVRKKMSLKKRFRRAALAVLLAGSALPAAQVKQATSAQTVNATNCRLEARQGEMQTCSSEPQWSGV
jgi:hypothetical protein